MDFGLSEQQKMLRQTVRDFATNEIEPEAAAIDEREEFPSGIVKQMAEMGLLGLTIPEAYGGSGMDVVSEVLVAEELSRASGSVGAIYLAHISLALHPLFELANEEQRHRYVAPCARGEKIACFALTEPEAGSDPASIKTMATPKNDGYIISGNKIFITNGDEAGVAVVFATLDPSQGYRSINEFVVEKGTPGFSVGKKEQKLGIRGSSTVELIFEDCWIPESNLIGERNRGFRQALEAIDGSRITVAAQAVGIAQAAFDAALSYAKERCQFGQPIASLQAIQWMLADMATQIDAARLLVYRAAWLKDQGEPFVKEAAMAKVFAAEASREVTNKALQIHGGYGYIKDYPLERYLRDAKITEIYEGTSEIQRMTIARSLVAGG
ncbi:acyl-CoA dehydrogenase [Chloroflexota bacterium]